MLFEFQQKETKGTKKLKKRTQVGQETDGRNQYSLDCFFFLIFVTFVPFCSRIEVQKDLWGKGRAGRRRSQWRPFAASTGCLSADDANDARREASAQCMSFHRIAWSLSMRSSVSLTVVSGT